MLIIVAIPLMRMRLLKKSSGSWEMKEMKWNCSFG
jgi:hypothetical protein